MILLFMFPKTPCRSSACVFRTSSSCSGELSAAGRVPGFRRKELQGQAPFRREPSREDRWHSNSGAIPCRAHGLNPCRYPEPDSYIPAQYNRRNSQRLFQSADRIPSVLFDFQKASFSLFFQVNKLIPWSLSSRTLDRSADYRAVRERAGLCDRSWYKYKSRPVQLRPDRTSGRLLHPEAVLCHHLWA